MVILTNIASVSKIDELRLLLKHRPFDVLCLNETLCDSTISDEEISIDGFSLLRNDRTRHGGGVAIYISNNFKHTRRHNIEPDMLECVLTEVKYSNYKPPSLLVRFTGRPTLVLISSTNSMKFWPLFLLKARSVFYWVILTVIFPHVIF